MANWACDPLPHVPLRHEVYVTSYYTLHNKDLAIMKLQLAVHKDDFRSLATALCSFQEVHQVSVMEIQPCPLGDAYV